MELLLVAFVAGVLTVLAPCVLPLLPVIIGGSLGGTDRKRPYIIVVSLMISLLVFTLALKATTALLNIPPAVWTTLSGGIVLALGVVTVWPKLYEWISAKTGFLNTSQQALGTAGQRGGWLGPVLIGAALGPVFASCSPTYAIIIATILPASFIQGVGYLLVYLLGLGLFMLAIALLGRRLTRHLSWAANPNGWFKRGLGVLFILIGLAVITGIDKRVETWLTDHQIFDATKLEQQLLPGAQSSESNAENTANGVAFSIAHPAPAPEFAGLTNWLNSDPTTLASLKGKVVLVDFWTYSCINCINTLPHVEGWYEKYKDAGLVVIGVHAPEFAFERVPANVAKAVKDDHLTYPVAQDNDMATWRAYSNQYWPASYFIDRQGRLRHFHFGEGEYDKSEAVIRALLAEDGTPVGGSVDRLSSSQPSSNHSPETYLGFDRAERNQNAGGLVPNQAVFYALPESLVRNGWALGGTWTVGAQDTIAGSGATLRYRFSGKEVFLVMGSSTPARVRVLVNGRSVRDGGQAGIDVAADGSATIEEPRLYRLVNSSTQLDGATIELQFDTGVSVNAFTFGS